jgi:RNA recognition motif-containing protein
VKIYVGNLSFETTDNQLNELFAKHGEVTSASVVMDRMTGRSRGFGFVEMRSDSAAKDALTALAGTELSGRTINVSEAKPRAEKTGPGYRR